MKGLRRSSSEPVLHNPLKSSTGKSRRKSAPSIVTVTPVTSDLASKATQANFPVFAYKPAQSRRTISIDHTSTIGPTISVRNIIVDSKQSESWTCGLRKIDPCFLQELHELHRFKFIPPAATWTLYKLLDSATNREDTLTRIFSPGACCTGPSPAVRIPFVQLLAGDLTLERFLCEYQPWGRFDSPFFIADTQFSESSLQSNPETLKTIKEQLKQKLEKTSVKCKPEAKEAINKMLDLITAIEEKTVPKEFPSKEMLRICMKQFCSPSIETEKATLQLIQTSFIPQTHSRSAINIDKIFVGQLAQHFTSGCNPPFILEVHAGSGLLADELHKQNVNIIATDACFSHLVNKKNIHTVYFSIDSDALIFFKEQTRLLDNLGIAYNPYILCVAPGGDMKQLTRIMLRAMKEITNLKIVMIGVQQLRPYITQASHQIVIKDLTNEFRYQQVAPTDKIYEYQKNSKHPDELPISG